MQEGKRCQGIEPAMNASYGGWEPDAEQKGAGAATVETVELDLPSIRQRVSGGSDGGRPRFEPSARADELTEDLGQAHAILVVGDHGWNGAAYDDATCRPLMELAGRPLIAHTLDWIRRQGIRSAGICANSNTDAVRHCLGDGRAWGMSLEYYSDVMPRGSAGCIRDAAGDSDARTFLVVTGMVVPRVGMAEAFDHHRQTGAALTVVSCPAGGGIEPAGLYLVSAGVLDRIAPTGYQDLKESLIPRLRRRGERIALFPISEQEVLRVTDLDSYLRANQRMLSDSLIAVCGPDYVQHGEAWIHQTCDVHPTARIIGPVLIAAGCGIQADAVIVGPAAIGAGCLIGRGAVVSRSTLWSRCRVGRDALVDNSLFLRNSTLGSNSQARNTCRVGA